MVLQASLRGRPGAAYVDIPSNILMAELPPGVAATSSCVSSPGAGGAEMRQLSTAADAGLRRAALRMQPDAGAVGQLVTLLRSAQR